MEEDWQKLDLQADVSFEPTQLHSLMYDPTQNLIIISTIHEFILVCAPSTLDCRQFEVSGIAVSMATDYKGTFYGVDYTNGALYKDSSIPEFVGSRYGEKRLWVPKNPWTTYDMYTASIHSLDGRWYAGNNFGSLLYTPKGAKIFVDRHDVDYDKCGYENRIRDYTDPVSRDPE